VYGALKRLQVWNEASVRVISAADIVDMSPTFTVWSDSLCATVTSIDRAAERLPLWHGSVVIYGSEVDLLHSLTFSTAVCMTLKCAVKLTCYY